MKGRRGNMMLYVLLSLAAALYFIHGDKTGLSLGATPEGRFSFTFVHASILHLCVNAFALSAVARSNFRITPFDIAAAYMIAVASPVQSLPVVGASAFTYAIFGIISWQSRNVHKFNMWVVGFILVGMLIAHNFANTIHLYAYLAGCVLGYSKKVR